MDTEKGFLTSENDALASKNDALASENQKQDLDSRIKEQLKKTLEPEIYEKWIEKFVFEKEGNTIIASYRGTDKLKEFKKNYKEAIWLRICSVAGYVKKFKICMAKAKKEKPKRNATSVAIIGDNADCSERIKKPASRHFKAARLFGVSIVFAFVMLAVAIIGGSYAANRSFKESFYSVGSLKVNGKVRLIQISDLHTARYGKDNQKLIDRVKKLKPDVIVYTGDCVDSSSPDSKKIQELIGSLKDVAPSYYVYGNNEVEKVYGNSFTKEAIDKMLGFDDKNRKAEALNEFSDSLEAELEKAGAKVLKNEADTITVNNTELEIFGVLTTNPSAFWDYAGQGFSEYTQNNQSKLKITLAHEPFIFEDFQADTWGDIILCGHTHGGTIRVPMVGPLYTREGGILPERSGKLVYGRYEVSGSPLIVSAGLENNDLLRINNQPELVIVDINRF